VKRQTGGAVPAQPALGRADRQPAGRAAAMGPGL